MLSLLIKALRYCATTTSTVTAAVCLQLLHDDDDDDDDDYSTPTDLEEFKFILSCKTSSLLMKQL